MTLNKEMAVNKITELSAENVLKVLIFMAGMQAEHVINEKCGTEKQRNLESHRSVV